MLKNLKLSKKLILGLGIMVAISAAMMITAIVYLHDIGGLVNKLYQKSFYRVNSEHYAAERNPEYGTGNTRNGAV